MNNDSVGQVIAEPVVPTETVTVPRECVPVAEVLRQIGRDAANDPQRYLEETAVPHGGE